MSPDCPGLPTALSNAADERTSMRANITTSDTKNGGDPCADVKVELAQAKKKIIELEAEIHKLMTNPVIVNVPGLSDIQAQQQAAIEGYGGVGYGHKEGITSEPAVGPHEG